MKNNLLKFHFCFSKNVETPKFSSKYDGKWQTNNGMIMIKFDLRNEMENLTERRVNFMQ
jgi:hypothetical protein